MLSTKKKVFKTPCTSQIPTDIDKERSGTRANKTSQTIIKCEKSFLCFSLVKRSNISEEKKRLTFSKRPNFLLSYLMIYKNINGLSFHYLDKKKKKKIKTKQKQ